MTFTVGDAGHVAEHNLISSGRNDAALAAIVGGDVAAFDTFARGDGALVATDAGHDWSVLSGTAAVAGGKASGSAGVAVVDTGHADVDITVAWSPFLSSSARVLFRVTDAANYVYVDLTATGLRLRTLTASVVANVTANFSGGIAEDASVVVRVRAVGPVVQVYRDGELVNTTTLTGDELLFGGTSHGFYLTSTARVDFAVWRNVPVIADPDVQGLVVSGLRASLTADWRKLSPHAVANRSATATLAIETYSYTYPSSANRFRSAVVAPDGVVYAIPRAAEFFHLWHPDGTTEDLTLGLTTTQFEGLNVSGGTLAPDGNIYCPPRDSDEVLIIDTYNRTASLTDFGLDLSGDDKWTGAVLGPDGRVYCIPTTAGDILIIDPATQTAERTNYGLTWTGGKRWIGGVLAPNGKIYCIPYNQVDVLVIDPLTRTAELTDLDADLSGTSKWSGGALGADGRIYCPPRNAAHVLIIDPATNTAELEDFGLAMTLGDNKWTRAVPGPDGKLYCAPQDYTDLLIIDPLGKSAVRSDLGTAIASGVQKYIGGVQGLDGTIYITPDLASNFLVISSTADPMPGELVLSATLNKSP